MNKEKAKNILMEFRRYNKYYKEGKSLTITITFEAKEVLNEAIRVLLIAYEEEKEKNKKILSDNIESFQEYFSEEFNAKFICKNKLKEILGIEETDTEKILSLLQTIVDENNRLEDIEDKKVQIEYNNVFNKGVKSVEDKIKAKIEVMNTNIVNAEKFDCDYIGQCRFAKYVLQSLLEKE